MTKQPLFPSSTGQESAKSTSGYKLHSQKHAAFPFLGGLFMTVSLKSS